MQNPIENPSLAPGSLDDVLLVEENEAFYAGLGCVEFVLEKKQTVENCQELENQAGNPKYNYCILLFILYMMTDPIADMLTRIRNAQMARLHVVAVPQSKLKKNIADILLKEGYVSSVETTDANPVMLVIGLKYHGKQPHIQSIKRESKPGHRKYCKVDELPRILNDYGIAIISTPSGLLTNKDARKQGTGGEIICSVY